MNHSSHLAGKPCLSRVSALILAAALMWAGCGDSWGQAPGKSAGKTGADGMTFRPDRILARPKPAKPAERAAQAAAQQQLHARLGLSVKSAYANAGGIQVLNVPPAKLADALEQLRASGIYTYAEPDYIRHISLVPNDPSMLNGDLWGLHNTGLNGGTLDADIDGPEAWDIRNSAASVVVAIVDTGVRYTHEDIAANMWHNPGESGAGKETNGVDDDGNGYIDDVFGIDAVNNDGDPMDDQGHGSHCAGTVAAVGNNGVGVVGVAWQAKIMACKFLSSSGSGSDSDAIACIDYARSKGAHILSNSWGGGPYGQALRDSIAAARASGMIFVAAAGNDSSDNDAFYNYPSNYGEDNIVAVASTTRTDALSSFSNFGAGLVEVAAPGSEILSLGISTDSSYSVKSGTSMATPHVSGLLALLRAQFPTDNYRQLINRMQRTGNPLPSLAGKTQNGTRINAAAALASVNNRPHNDDWQTAAPLTASEVLARGSNSGATMEAGDPLPASFPGAEGTLWWRWVAPAAGNVLVSTAGSAIDTVLGVYSGNALNSLTPLAVNDDEAVGSITSRAAFQSAAGAAYYIAVAGKAGVAGYVQLQIGAAPGNDNFAAATPLTGAPVSLSASNRNATLESGEPTHGGVAGGASVWWRWTAPDARSYSITTAGSNFDTTLGVYQGSALGALTSVAQNDDDGSRTTSRVTFSTTAGATYHIAVAGKAGAQGSIALQIAAPPSNDDFAHPNTIPAAGGTVTGTNVGGSREAGEPNHGSSNGSSSVWWSWTPTTGGPVEIATSGSDFDTLLGVYTGSALASLTTVATDDDSGAGLTSLVSFSATAGTTYRIAVDGYGGATGAIALAVSPIVAPPVITSPSTAVGYLGASFNYLITATNAPDSFSAAGLPPGLSVNTSTGLISGTPTAHGSYLATIAAANAIGQSSASLAITVSDVSADIADALDAPGRLFSPGGAAPWFKENAVTHDGIDAAQSGDVGNDESSTVATTVTGPAQVAFWWKVSSEEDYDTLDFSIDGTLVDSITGEIGWSRVLSGVPAGNHTLTWTYRKDFIASSGSDAGWVDQLEIGSGTAPPVLTSASSATAVQGIGFAFIVTATNFPSAFSATGLPAGLSIEPSTGRIAGTPSTLGTYTCTVSASNAVGTATGTLTLSVVDFSGSIGQAVDNTTLAYSASGNGAWFSQSAIQHDGTDAAQSGPIPDSSTTSFQTTVTGPAIASFWTKVSSESGYDYFTHYLDSTVAESVSGEAPWARKYVSVPSGSHVLKWTYSKDSIVSAGLDAAWVDELVMIPAPTTAAFMIPQGRSIGFQEPLLGQSGYVRGIPGSVELGWSASGAAVTEAGNRNPPLTGTIVSGSAGIKSLVINNSSASFVSDPIYLDGYINPIAQADVRTYTTSSTTFESSDALQIGLQVSTNGLSWANGPDILPVRVGGTPDQLIALNTSAVTQYQRFTTSPGAIPASVHYVRFRITGTNDSSSEYFVIDNLSIQASPPNDSDFDGYPSDVEWWFGSSSTAAGSYPTFTATPTATGIVFQFSSVAGNTYLVEKSLNLATWIPVATVTATSAATGYTAPPASAAERAYYRIRKP